MLSELAEPGQKYRTPSNPLAPANSASLTAARSVLLQYFGYGTFRPVQEKAVQAVLSGRDALIVLPTGGGKSICYQIPALMRRGITVVVSPLISLMKDQVGALLKRGISAAYLNSTVSADESLQCTIGIRNGTLRLLYLAPERLENLRTLEELKTARVALLAVDEAHCISEWGHDFRPVYRRIGAMREVLGFPQTVALTATATPDVREDIVKQLKLNNSTSVIGGFDRTNLSYHVRLARTQKEKDLATVSLLRRTANPAIVYSPTRKSVERITVMLNRSRIRAIAYHAGLDDSLRQRSQDAFMNCKARVIVATSAFGMGIDKPDVRLVVHHGIPGSLEAYYQEAGRAGRDGLSSTCVLLFSPADRFTHEYFIAGTNPARRSVEAVLQVLRSRSSANGTPVVSNSAISIALKGRVEHREVAAALRLLTSHGVCHVESPSDRVWIRPTAQRNRFERELAEGSRELSLMSWLHDKDQSAHAHDGQYYSIAHLTRAFPVPTGIDGLLKSLSNQQMLVYARRVDGVRLNAEFLEKLPSSFSWKSLDRRRASDLNRLRHMQRYASTRQCRRAFVLSYFGERLLSPFCGACDRCLGNSDTLPTIP